LTAHQLDGSSLTFTGERFLPEVRGAIWYEHWHRYAVAAPLAEAKRVLDAACGEGYGSFLLARSASSVVGVDLSQDTISHASQRYAQPNLRFEAASVTQLPLADASVDVVVSFETIEHLSPQAEMLAEFRRVLAPDGVLVLSSPNKPVYNEGGVANPYHVRELDRAELAQLLATRFPQQAWYAQRVLAHSVVWAEDAASAPGAFLTLIDDRPTRASEPAPPMYFLVIAAAAGVPLPTLPSVSLFEDGALSLWRDYSRALNRERELAWDELNARKIAEDRLAELVPAINALASANDTTRAQQKRIGDLEAALVDTQAKAQSAIAALEAALAERERVFAREVAVARDAATREAAAHGETRARLAYRESARGWLRFPFAAIRQRMGQR
jgi:2-polyprenyl-3-methyl-5-hydroxy-6-metoxy-1,4-benzoquinol methylase